MFNLYISSIINTLNSSIIHNSGRFKIIVSHIFSFNLSRHISRLNNDKFFAFIFTNVDYAFFGPAIFELVLLRKLTRFE